MQIKRWFDKTDEFKTSRYGNIIRFTQSYNGGFEGVVEAIKTKLVNDDLYRPDVNGAIENVSCGKALCDAILPIYNLFCRKKNQDVLLEEFYGSKYKIKEKQTKGKTLRKTLKQSKNE